MARKSYDKRLKERWLRKQRKDQIDVQSRMSEFNEMQKLLGTAIEYFLCRPLISKSTRLVNNQRRRRNNELLVP